MKKTIMKVMALLLAVVLLLPSSAVFAATSNDNAQQIVDNGGKHSVYDDISSDSIEVSKTLTSTANENYLDITLQVRTKDNLKELYDSVAVVLVLDASHTMLNNERVDNAQRAISQFISKYYGSDFNASDKELGIVAFNTHAQTYADLDDYSGRTNELSVKLGNVVSAIKEPAYKDSHNRFTNIEAGLILAKNLLMESKAMHKFIVIATDGFPTTYAYRKGHSGNEHGEIGTWNYEVSHITDSTDTAKIRGYCPYMTCSSKNCFHADEGASWGDPGYFANGFVKTNKRYCTDSSCGNENGTYAGGKYHAHGYSNLECDHGTNYSDWAAWAAEEAAKYIKNEYGINIFSIGIDIGGQTIHSYLESDLSNILNATSPFSTMEFPSSSVDPIIGFDTSDYENWLGKEIGGSKFLGEGGFYLDYKSASSSVDLIFDTISAFVTNVKKASLAKWVISDPIPENFEFIGFKNANGANYDSSGKSISWDLKKVEPVASDGVYTYTASYRIRIKTEKDGFVSEKAYNTNGTTNFEWDKWNDEDKKWEEQKTEFPIPKAQGYLGSLEFTKVDSVTKEGISGAEFTLKHSDECSVCKAANNFVTISDIKATSNADGKVSFTKIPSGHDYVLSETKAPNGYQNYGTNHNVTVAYGVTTVSGINGGKVENVKIQPTEISIPVKKTADGKISENQKFEFVIEENGNEIGTVELGKGETGEFKISYSEWGDMGEHIYTVREIIPQGATSEGFTDEIAYSTEVYTVKINVKLDDENAPTKYVAEIKEFSGDANNVALFHNEYLDPAEVKFSVSKTLDSAAPSDKTFEFELKEGDTVIDTVTITGNGTAEFKTIVYDSLGKRGDHTYTVSEKIPAEAVEGNTDEFAYDRTVYTVTLNVAADGTKYVVTDSKGENYGGENFAFHNEYLDPAKIVFAAEKKADTNAPANDEFTFVLKENGVQIGEPIKVKKGESKPFPEIVYNSLDQCGEHTYTVEEVVPQGGMDNRYVYDTTVHEITVKVDVENREAYVVRDDSGNIYSGETLVFENEYIDPVEVNLSATKTLEGYEEVPNDFSFTIEGEGIKETVQNTGNAVTFSTLTFDKPGTYNYKVYETIGDNLSILYDRTVYDVTVTVTHDTDEAGKIIGYKAEVGYGDGVSAMVFENTFREPVEVVLEAKKTVNNHAPVGRVFEFELIDEDGNVVSKGTNDINGKIVFEKLTFDKAGTYHFEMKEVSKLSFDMIYDKKTYDVEIVVTADSSDDDPFEATVTISRKGKVLENVPVFRNITMSRDEGTEDKNPSTGAFVGLSYAALAAAGGFSLYKFIKKRKEK